MAVELTHHCPRNGQGFMPCCGRTPLEVPADDRITQELWRVTCVLGIDVGDLLRELRAEKEAHGPLEREPSLDAVVAVLDLHSDMAWYTTCMFTEFGPAPHRAVCLIKRDDHFQVGEDGETLTCEANRVENRCVMCTPDHPDDDDIPWPCPTVVAVVRPFAPEGVRHG